MNKVGMMVTARKLMRDVSDLPTIPGIVSQVISLLDNPDSSPDKIADLILSDKNELAAKPFGENVENLKD